MGPWKKKYLHCLFAIKSSRSGVRLVGKIPFARSFVRKRSTTMEDRVRECI